MMHSDWRLGKSLHIGGIGELALRQRPQMPSIGLSAILAKMTSRKLGIVGREILR